MSSSHLPPHLRRRGFLKLGIASAVVLAVAGGAVALIKPGLIDGKTTPSTRLILTQVAQGMLAGSLPAGAVERQRIFDGMMERTDVFISGLPNHVQAELSQLFGLLATAAGRRGIVGISASWETVSVDEMAAALDAMRASGMELRIQSYQGLHDLVCVPYFAGNESWALLGYPGPAAV
jgi:hypothetical protein